MEIMYREGDRLFIQNVNEKLQIEAWGRDSIRVRSVLMGEILDTKYALLDKPEGCVPEIKIEEKELTTPFGKMKRLSAEFINGKLSVRAEEDRAGIHLSFYKDGRLILDEPSEASEHLKARQFRPIIGGDYGLRVHFMANKYEKLYGMGQYQSGLLDLKGSIVELVQRNTQASVPFVLSSLGYGFFWHDPAIGRATFGTNYTVWEAESSRQLDYWLTAGDTPADIIKSYVSVTGLPPMMPEYGLGFWQCKLRYWNQEQILKIARDYHDRGVKLDVIVCDFFHWPYTGDFRFDYEFFPDPKAMVEELESLGTKLMCSIWPQVDSRSENYRELSKKGLMIRSEYGCNIAAIGGDNIMQFIDVTNPATWDFVWDKMRENYIKNGVKLFWLDEAEPELDPCDFNNYRYYAGSALQIGNIYPQRFSAMFYDNQIADGQEDVVNLVRCAWAGSQRYGALVWSGDIKSKFETLRIQLCAGLNMGIAGIPWWTTDIGGFTGGEIHDPEFKELMVRWFEWGAFCPVMRLHGMRNDNTKPRERVVNAAGEQKTGSGADNEIWSYGEDNYEIMKLYVALRERLRDYSREAMREAHESGAPVMRTLFYEFPKDDRCWDVADEYLYGGDLLVAPVMDYLQRSRRVYLPEGADWTDAWTGEVYKGGETVYVESPLERIPVFLREGRYSEIFVNLQ